MMLFVIIVCLGFGWSLEHVQMFKETLKCLSGLAEPVVCDRGTVQEACALDALKQVESLVKGLSSNGQVWSAPCERELCV